MGASGNFSFGQQECKNVIINWQFHNYTVYFKRNLCEEWVLLLLKCIITARKIKSITFSLHHI